MCNTTSFRLPNPTLGPSNSLQILESVLETSTSYPNSPRYIAFLDADRKGKDVMALTTSTSTSKATYDVDRDGDVLLLPQARFQGRVFNTHFTGIRVSSVRLQQAAPLLYELIHDGFVADVDLDVTIPVEVALSTDHDPEAMVILLKILHGQTRGNQIPLELDLYVLYAIAYLVDLYELQSLRCMRVFVPRWIEKAYHEYDLDDMDEKVDLIVTIVEIGWCLNLADVFRDATRALIIGSHRVCTELEVVSHDAGKLCASDINYHRESLLRDMFDAVWDAYIKYDTDMNMNVTPGKPKYICSRDCHQRISGYLDNVIRKLSVVSLEAKSPANYRAMFAGILKHSPAWHPVAPGLLNQRDRIRNTRPCEAILRRVLDRFNMLIEGGGGVAQMELSAYRGGQVAVNREVRVEFRRLGALLGGST